MSKTLVGCPKDFFTFVKTMTLREVVKLIHVLQESRSDYAFYGVISFFRTAYKMMSAVV